MKIYRTALGGDNFDDPVAERRERAADIEQREKDAYNQRTRDYLLDVQDVLIRYRTTRDGKPTTNGTVAIPKADIHQMLYNVGCAIERIK